MKTLAERIAFLVSQRETLEKWVGAYDAVHLRKWLDAELGDSRRLEEWVEGSRVVPRGPVLHVVSANTGHAAFQTVFRAILVGCRSWVKVPSAGLPEFEEWAHGIELLEVRRELPEEWRAPEVAVIYGGAETIGFFREWLAPETRIIEHGPKLSAAFVFSEREGIFQDLAQDIMRYGQRGCLSVQAIYLHGDAKRFCESLAEALETWGQSSWSTSDSIHPAKPSPEGRSQSSVAPSLSESGAVRNERELTRFRIANGADMAIWESENSTDWTVVWDTETTTLRPGPGSGFVRVFPMPEEISPETLGSEARFLSTTVVEPITAADLLENLSPPRICASGRAQEPGILWHPDGEMPLAGLVRWRDLG